MALSLLKSGKLAVPGRPAAAHAEAALAPPAPAAPVEGPSAATAQEPEDHRSKRARASPADAPPASPKPSVAPQVPPRAARPKPAAELANARVLIDKSKPDPRLMLSAALSAALNTAAAPATLPDLVTSIMPHLHQGPPPIDGTKNGDSESSPEKKTVRIERFTDPVDLANTDPGTQYLRAFIDMGAHMELNNQRRAQAGRTEGEKKDAYDAAAPEYQKTASLLSAGTDHMQLFGMFYALGEYEKIAESIPALKTPTPVPGLDSIPAVSRSHINKYMYSYSPRLGAHVQKCANWKNCMFRMLSRMLDHPDPVRRNNVYMPGRAFLLPSEEADPDFCQPRLCYFCQLMVMNVTYETNQRRGEALTPVNGWRVITNAVGEYPAEGVRQAYDGNSCGLVGAIPFFDTHRLNLVEASEPDGAYGFVDSTPVFGAREPACHTPL